MRVLLESLMKFGISLETRVLRDFDWVVCVLCLERSSRRTADHLFTSGQQRRTTYWISMVLTARSDNLVERRGEPLRRPLVFAAVFQLP